MLLDAGTTDPGMSRDEGSGYYGIHLLTPETATTTHYHFSSVRRKLDDGGELIETVRGAGYRLGGVGRKPVARHSGHSSAVTSVAYA